MNVSMKLFLAGLVAALVMMVAITFASAGRLSTSNSNIRVTWTLLTFTAGEFTPVSCPLTLEGSFHSRTIGKISRALIGYISRVTVSSGSCTGGTATLNQTSLPWHFKYMGFSGTLPNITGIEYLLDGISFETETGTGIVCTANSEANNPGDGVAQREAGGAITGMRAREEVSIPVSGFLCPSSGRWSGTGTLTLLGATTRITITLI